MISNQNASIKIAFQKMITNCVVRIQKATRITRYALQPWGIATCLLLTLLLIGCGPDEISPTLVVTPFPTPVSDLPPTFTPPSASDRLFPTFPVVTVTQRPLSATNTPINFGETAVELRYIIPTLGLDRRMQGSISSQIILVDETSGQAIKRNNQAAVLLDLQQALPELLLPVVPDGCEGCVFISYDLPFAELHGEGWLRDPVMLASLENYMAVGLGPYFPPNTVAGLRRSASPFAPAHTVALTADGLLYTWLASESEVSPPVPADPALLAALSELSLTGLRDEYAASCIGSPLESLFIQQGDMRKTIGLVCPEYALPAPLLLLYAGLDAAMTDKLAQRDEVIERPPTDFPLTAVLDYKRVDGARLTVYGDGTAVTQPADGESRTTVISPTLILTLTNELIASGAVRTGLNTFGGNPTSIITNTEGVTVTVTATPKPPRSSLVLRGPGGVYDGEWFNTSEVVELIALNELLNQLLNLEALPEEAETPNAEGTGTPVETGAPVETSTPVETGTPIVNQTAVPTATIAPTAPSP